MESGPAHFFATFLLAPVAKVKRVRGEQRDGAMQVDEWSRPADDHVIWTGCDTGGRVIVSTITT